MREYQTRPTKVLAVEWNRPGDHPDAESLLALKTPGTMVVTYADGMLEIMSKQRFAAKFEQIPAATA